MIKPPLPEDEATPLENLERLGIRFTLAEERFKVIEQLSSGGGAD